MKKRVFQISKYTGIVIGVLLVFILLITLIINGLYREKIIRFTLHELNKQLNVPINVGKVDFSIWKTFPNASIEFDNVMVNSTTIGKDSVCKVMISDTLLKAETIYLEMNPIKLLFGTYKLNRLLVKNSFIKLKVNESGETNYNIIKKAKNKAKGDFDFNFDNIQFINTLIEYTNNKLAFRFKGSGDKLYLKGDFRPDRFSLDIDTKMFINLVEIGGYNYLSNKHLNVRTSLKYVNDFYQIALSKITIEGVNVLAQGNFHLNQTSSIDVKVEGKKLSISKLTNLLPEKMVKMLGNYSQKGTISLKFLMNGSIGKGNTPKIEVSFIVDNGTFIEKTSGIKLARINLNGYYSNVNHKANKTDILKINGLSAKLGSGNLSGDLTIQNLVKPIVDINIISKLNLNDIKSFLNLDTIEILNGWVESSLSMKGKLNIESKVKISDFAALSYLGIIKIKDGCFKIKNIDYNFNKIEGEISLKNDIMFKNLNFNLHENDFHVNGTLLNGVPYFLSPTESAILTADISSRNLDLTKYFISSPESSPNKQAYSRQLLFPENLTLDVKLKINNFKLHKFNAKWVNCNLYYKPTIFTIKSVSFESMDGHISGNGLIVQDMDRNFITKSQLDLSKVDIQKMFFTFNNFTQNIIKDNNLRGRLSGDISIASQWNNALVLDKDKLIVDGDITIDNGELVDFEYVKGLSKFVSMDELKTIRFKTLKNRITVKDKVVNIPQMDIYTSAFNIKASGVHSFDNHYTYKIKILLSDILWGKAKKRKKQNEEFGVVEDDGLGKTTIPLSIVGYNSDYKISYDSKEAFNVVKESLDKQKGEMKRIFHDEFGWFKNDSTLKQTKQQKKQNIGVSWDDDNPSGDNNSSNTGNAKQKEKSKTKDEKVQVEWDN